MRLAVFAFELIAMSLLGACYGYSPNDAAFIQKDIVAPVQVSHQAAINTSVSFQSWGSVTTTGFRVMAWVDGNDNFPRAAVFDAITGQVVGGQVARLSSVASVNVYVGSQVNGSITSYFVVTADTGAANIRGYVLTITSGVIGTWSAGTVLSDADYSSTNGTFACAFVTGTTGNTVIVGYEKTGGGNSSLVLRAYSPGLFFQLKTTTALTAGTNTMRAFGARGVFGETVWVGFYAVNTGYASKVVFLWFDPTTLVASATSTVPFTPSGSSVSWCMGFERMSATQVMATFSDDLQSIYGQWTSSGIVGVPVTVNNAGIASAPFVVAPLSTTYLMMKESKDFAQAGGQGSYYLVDLQSADTTGQFLPRIVAVLAPSIVNIAFAPLGSSAQRCLPQWDAPTSTTYSVGLPIVRTGAGRQGLELFTLDLAAKSRFSQAQTLGKELYWGGFFYDGRQVVENGFPQAPFLQPLVNNGGAGSSFQYAITFARVDAQGNIEESAPSLLQTVTSGVTPNVTVIGRTVALTNKQRALAAGASAGTTDSRIYMLVYRTPALASGDTTLYRVTTEPFAAGLVNLQTSSTISFTDTTSDASLTDGTHPVLYTQTGELTHNVPETFTAITGHKQRVWGIGADQRTIWFSQTYSDGQIPAWNNTFQLTVDDAGEPLTCLASLYDKLVIFTRSKIYVVYGDGPSIAGTGSDLQAPQRVPSMAGCIDPRSVVNTPMGIMFQSQRGIELLGPDLQVQFIGQPVSTTTQTYPNCTSAAFVESNSVVRFTFAQISDVQPTSGGQSGAIVNFDIRRGRWAVHRVTWAGSKGGGFFGPMQASVVHPTLGYVAAHNDTGANPALIYREKTAADSLPWTDFETFFVPLSVTTAWIKSGDLQGWQSIRRIRLLANYYDHHDLSLSLAYDYQGVSDSFAYTDATIQTFRVGSYEQVEVTPGAGRRCEAIQATIQVNSNSGFASGRGAGLIGLAFEVRAQRGGFRKIPAAART